MVEKPEQDSAAFGFRRVPVGAKQGLVSAVFDSVAERYDLMNDLMSLGTHRLWKDELVGWLAPRSPIDVLDVAGGTGDIAFRILDACAAAAQRPGAAAGEARVTVCDINERMLAVGRDRALDRGLLHGIEWVCGNAEALPVARGAVDAVTIAFGIRNVPRIDVALAEMRRVLRPGGRFLCLEFTPEVAPAIEPLYRVYSFKALPALGALFAGDAASYRYLAESIRTFPDVARFAAMIEAAGFERVTCRRLFGGIAAIHSAWRL